MATAIDNQISRLHLGISGHHHGTFENNKWAHLSNLWNNLQNSSSLLSLTFDDLTDSEFVETFMENLPLNNNIHTFAFPGDSAASWSHLKRLQKLEILGIREINNLNIDNLNGLSNFKFLQIDSLSIKTPEEAMQFMNAISKLSFLTDVLIVKLEIPTGCRIMNEIDERFLFNKIFPFDRTNITNIDRFNITYSPTNYED